MKRPETVTLLMHTECLDFQLFYNTSIDQSFYNFTPKLTKETKAAKRTDCYC